VATRADDVLADSASAPGLAGVGASLVLDNQAGRG
jgi:hypothetical protein